MRRDTAVAVCAVSLALCAVLSSSQTCLGPCSIEYVGPGAAACTDSTDPVLGTLDPSGAGTLPGNSYTLEADATDDEAMDKVCFYYVYCGALGCADAFSTATLIGCDDTPSGDTYSILWSFPNCGQSPESLHNVWFQAVDACGNTDEEVQDDQALSGRGC